MVSNQISPDSATVGLVLDLIKDLSKSAEGISPTTGNGFEFGLKAIVVLVACLVLAVFCLGGVLIYIFKRWEAGQAAGIKALSANKDKTKQEITELLKSELGNARAANVADANEYKSILSKYGESLSLVVLDLAIIGQKLKIPMRSSPTSEIKTPPKEGG